jgi:hypothetical protein
MNKIQNESGHFFADLKSVYTSGIIRARTDDRPFLGVEVAIVQAQNWKRDQARQGFASFSLKMLFERISSDIQYLTPFCSSSYESSALLVAK